MKLSDRTVSILKNVSSVNNTLVVKSGNVIKHKPLEGIMPYVKATVAETFPVDFQIYNLQQLLALLNQFDEPDIEFFDDHLEIKDEAGHEGNVTYASMDSLKDPIDYKRNIKMPSVEQSFKLSSNDLQSVFKAAKMLQQPQIAFIGDGKKLRLSTYDMHVRSADSFKFIVGETDRKFTMALDVTLINMLAGDYQVDLSFRGVARFMSEAEDSTIEYWLGANEKSKYDN